MEIKKRKNEYGHEVADCPFCKAWVYIRDAVPSRGQHEARDMFRHITNEAKKEALSVAIDTMKAGDAKHLAFYKENTQPYAPRTITEAKREYKPSTINVV